MPSESQGNSPKRVLKIDPDFLEAIESFIEETSEFADQIVDLLMELELDPGNLQTVDQIFRKLHTVKGNAAAFDFDHLKDLAHQTEDVFRAMKNGRLEMSMDFSDTLFSAIDTLKEGVTRIKNQKLEVPDYTPVLGQLQTILQSQEAKKESRSTVHPSPKQVAPDVMDEPMPDLPEEIAQSFGEETEEILAGIEEGLMGLEGADSTANAVDIVFRAFHTLKGSAGSLGFKRFQTVSHRCEDILKEIKGGRRVHPEVTTTLLRSVDFLKGVLADCVSGKFNSRDIKPLMGELDLAFSEQYDKLPDYRQAQETEGAKKEVKIETRNIRVDLAKLDKLINLAGELNLTKNQFLNFESRMNQNRFHGNLLDFLEEYGAGFNLLSNEIQDAVTKVRMQPVQKVFSKYPRIVRDLAKELGKEIQLEIRGEETELDNQIIEQIGDPLIHMIRNSCDHGIETPEKRTAKGKPKVGTLVLAASYQGSFAVIEIKDDGGGIDPDIIGAKAVEKGVITKQERASMSSRQVLQLIFAAGFSTASQVSAVSGRGVGMDVVRDKIEGLKGSVELYSEVGKGTQFRIKLPLSLAIVECLEVSACGEDYLIPLESVVQTIRPDELNRLECETGEYRHDGIEVPLLELGDLLGAPPQNASQSPYVVLLGSETKRLGLLVDQVHDQYEAMVKSLTPFLTHMGHRAVSGAVIKGDGAVEYILDPEALLEHSRPEVVWN